MKKHITHQPIITDDHGVERFQQNDVVRYLLDWASMHGCDLNYLAIIPFDNDQRAQFAELIGYSVAGLEELSYVSDEFFEEATQCKNQ